MFYSELFPHKANPKIEPYDFDFAKDLLKQIGKKALGYNQRITMHPGQHIVVGTPNETALKNAILDLEYHAEMLDLMGCGKDSVIVIHGGGLYGNKEETIQRWAKNYKNLPQYIRNRFFYIKYFFKNLILVVTSL